MEIHEGRQSGMSHNPISWADLQAYLTLHGLRLSPWEVRCIRAFDRAFLATAAPEKTEHD